MGVDIQLVIASLVTPVAYLISCMTDGGFTNFLRTSMLASAGYVLYRIWGMFKKKSKDKKVETNEELEKKLQESEEEKQKLAEEVERLKKSESDAKNDAEELRRRLSEAPSAEEVENLRKSESEARKEAEELRKRLAEASSKKEEEEVPPPKKEEEVPPPKKEEEEVPPPKKEEEEVPPPKKEEEVPPPPKKEEEAPPPAKEEPSVVIVDDDGDMVEIASKSLKREDSIHEIIRKNEETQKIIDAISSIEDVNEPEEGTKQTPLHISAKTGNTAVCEALIERGADLKAKDAKENMPLHVASYYGNADVVELLASKDPSTVNEKNVNGNTPLHCFMNGKCSDDDQRNGVFNALVAHGADVSMSNNSEDSIFQLAIMNDMFDGVSELAKNMVDTFVQNNASDTMTHVNKRGESLLYTAAFYGKISIVRTMCEQKADVSIADNNGWQPLHAAASRGHADCCEELLHFGADVNAKALNGTTPAILASMDGWADVLRTLVKYNADLNQSNNDGWRPIHAACVRGQVDAMKFLLEQKVDVNCRCTNSRNHTPLMMCILSRQFNPDVMKALLDAGADWTVPSTGQYNCLHACTVKDNDVAARILAEYPNLTPKMDYNLREGKGKTAMDLCVANNARNTAKLISQKTGRRMPLNFSSRRLITPLAVPEAAPAPAEALTPEGNATQEEKK